MRVPVYRSVCTVNDDVYEFDYFVLYQDEVDVVFCGLQSRVVMIGPATDFLNDDQVGEMNRLETIIQLKKSLNMYAKYPCACLHNRSRIIPCIVSYMDKLLQQEAQHRLEEKSIDKIKTAFLKCYYDPTYQLCQHRNIRQYTEIM